MSTVRIRNLSKWFDSVQAIDRLDLEVEDREFLVVLGPSGCGKTTTLRCVAGIEEPTTGTIEFGNRCVYSREQGINVSPRSREIGMVFQNYALYPHLTVAENIGFGLKIRKTPRGKLERAVQSAIELVGLEGLEDRRPGELSGGQQQRAALARVIAREPEVLLFDEPLSNLDPKLRAHLRAELKDLHRRLETTSIFVTHDQEEAMIFGDRIVVMYNGRMTQIGTPEEIYNRPASVTVAGFTGRPKTNLIPGTIEQHEDTSGIRPEDDESFALGFSRRLNLAAGQKMILHVRPEELDLDLRSQAKPFTVYAVQPRGAETLLHLTYAAGSRNLLVRTTNSRATELTYGQRVGVTVHRGNIYSAESELLVTSFEAPPEEAGVTVPTAASG